MRPLDTRQRKSNSKRLIGLIIVFLMAVSVAGTAIFYQNPQQQQQEQKNEFILPPDFVFDRRLNSIEKNLFTSNGLVVIEYAYNQCDQSCVETIAELRILASRFEGFVFISVYSGSEVFELIGPAGIETLTQGEDLEEAVCEVPTAKSTKTCLLRSL